MPTITPGDSLQLFLFPARRLECFDKNEYCCLGAGQTCPREIIQVCSWGAGNDGRDFVSI